MAIIELAKNPCDTEEALQNLSTYIIDYDKTLGLYGGRGLTPETAFADIDGAQRLWHKTGGRRAYHFIVCFSDDEFLAPHDALHIAFAISSLFFPDYQVLYGVHSTQAHLHVHFAVNTVSLTDGRKLHMDYDFMRILGNQINSIISDYTS